MSNNSRLRLGEQVKQLLDYLYLQKSNPSPDWWALFHNLSFYLVERVVKTMFWISFYYRLLQLKTISLVLYYLQIVLEDFPFCNAKIIIGFCFKFNFYVKLVNPTCICTVVNFTAKINDWKPVLFFQSYLAYCLNSSLVMSLPTWSSKMWLRVFRSWGNRHEIRVLSDCLRESLK